MIQLSTLHCIEHVKDNINGEYYDYAEIGSKLPIYRIQLYRDNHWVLFKFIDSSILDMIGYPSFNFDSMLSQMIIHYRRDTADKLLNICNSLKLQGRKIIM